MQGEGKGQRREPRPRQWRGTVASLGQQLKGCKLRLTGSQRPMRGCAGPMRGCAMLTANATTVMIKETLADDRLYEQAF